MKLLATIASLLVASAAHADPSCAALKDLTLPATRITLAEAVTPAPDFPYPPSLFDLMAPVKSTSTPFCRVAGTIDEEIRFEIWLPKEWNGRFEGVGNGGLTGALNYPAMGDALAAGYATASTDTGHVTDKGFFETNWIPGHAQRVTDFVHRAHHLMAEKAKAIVAAFYAKPAHHAYFNGCSSGGWEGLSEAQRYPGDYDGIVAGAPANNFTRLQSRGLWTAELAAKDPAGNLPPDKAKLLVRAALDRCDKRDGVADGVIENPAACDFDPARLQCKAGDAPDCLTAPQVERAKTVYGPHKSPGGLELYPGPAWGSPPMIELPGEAANPATSMMVLVLKDRGKLGFTPANFDADRDLSAIEAEVGADFDTTQADLTDFAAKGGKLLLYHGWADPLLSPYNTIDYYGRVEQAMGGRAAAERFARLFMIPGMAHCRGGPGTDEFDRMAVLTDWVEHAKAPTVIPAAHKTDGKTDKTRPLCLYPGVARYKGAGSTDDAANFTCAAG